MRTRWVGSTERLYRAALGLCPASFTRKFGEEMAGAYGELARRAVQERGGFGVLTIFVRSLLDLAVIALREHVTLLPDRFRQNLRFAVRNVGSRPGFAILVVLTLGLGIGTTSAIFDVVYQVLMRPLPFSEPERLVLLTETDRARGTSGNDASPGNFEDWRAMSESLNVAAMVATSMNLTGEGEPERLQVQRVSANFFALLGVAPALGRAFVAEEDAPGAPRVALVTDGFWKRRFGGDRAVLGRDVLLDDTPHRVLGVLPPWFRFPNRDTDLYVPLAMSDEEREGRRSYYLDVIGRLDDGASLDGAREEMTAIARRLEELYPRTNADNGIAVAPLGPELTGASRAPLLFLLGATAAVLLIAAVNVANMLLARGSSRRREIAVRSALGASRTRLLGQLLTEALSLSILAGCVGFVFGLWTRRLLEVAVPPHMALDSSFFEPVSVLFALALSCAVGLGVGLLPAVSLTGGGMHAAMSDRSIAGGATRKLLVVGEIALALVLLVSAGLLIRSFAELSRVSPGFQSESVLTMRVELSPKRYPDHARKLAFYQELLSRVERLPDVVSAGVVTMLPLTFAGGSILFDVEGRSKEEGVEPIALFRSVSPDYLRAMGARFVGGRPFDATDDANAPRVAVVNETLARIHFSREDVLGSRLEIWGEWVEVVGVVADLQEIELGAEAGPAIYIPTWQRSFGFFDPRDLAVRTVGDPVKIAGSIRAEIWAIDRDQPIARTSTMAEIVGGSLARERLQTGTLTAFGSVALLLAALGIYGVLSYSVAQRTREIGLRKALGAGRGDLLRMVVGQGMRWTISGMMLGVAAALFLTRFLEGMLYGTDPKDPATVGSIVAILGGVALAACLVPALRASRIDPLVALRED